MVAVGTTAAAMILLLLLFRLLRLSTAATPTNAKKRPIFGTVAAEKTCLGSRPPWSVGACLR
jgi:hypothetical protein